MITSDCEFCTELNKPDNSRFTALYKGVIESRIIERSTGIAVLPTLGQLFAGSLLILPIMHFETIANMPQELRTECLKLASNYARRLRSYGNPILFEHGARCGTGRSCGIYHAHLHVVPVPDDLSVSEVLSANAPRAHTLQAAYDQLQGEDTYLVFQDTRGKVAYVSGAEARIERFQSQYFRQTLKYRFQLASPWDWREYAHLEPFVLETIRAMKGSNVALCC